MRTFSGSGKGEGEGSENGENNDQGKTSHTRTRGEMVGKSIGTCTYCKSGLIKIS